MASALNLVYSVFVVLLAVVGVGVVVGITAGPDTGREGRWSQWLGAIVVAVFLLVMVVGLLV